MGRFFSICVVLWGEEHRIRFVDLCLASLASANNLGLFRTREDDSLQCELVIYTTPDDKAHIIQSASYQALSDCVNFVFEEIGKPSRDRPTMLHMTDCHRNFLSRAINRKSVVFFLSPDVLLSDGSIATLIANIDAGEGCVLYPALRFDEEAVLSALKNGDYREGGVLSLPPPMLAKIACESRHTWMQIFDIQTDHFSDEPIFINFVKPNGDFAVMSTSWGVGALDCALIDETALDELVSDTIDAHFVDRVLYRNFGPSRLKLLTDCRDFLMVPVTSEAEMPYKDRLVPKKHLSTLAPSAIEKVKQAYVRTALLRDWSDEFKRWSVQNPVFVYGNEYAPEVKKEFLDECQKYVKDCVEIDEVPFTVHIYVSLGYNHWNDVMCRETMLSLTSPGNIPSLDPKRKNRLVLEVRSDFEASQLKEEQLIRFLTPYCELEFLVRNADMQCGVDGSNALKEPFNRRADEEDAIVISLTAGSVLSDGALVLIGQKLQTFDELRAPTLNVSAYKWFRETRDKDRQSLCIFPTHELGRAFKRMATSRHKNAEWRSKYFTTDGSGISFDYGSGVVTWGYPSKTLATHPEARRRWARSSDEKLPSTVFTPSSSRELCCIQLDRHSSMDWDAAVRPYQNAPQWVIDDMQSLSYRNSIGGAQRLGQVLDVPYVVYFDDHGKELTQEILESRKRAGASLSDDFDGAAKAHAWVRSNQKTGLKQFFFPTIGPDIFDRVLYIFRVPIGCVASTMKPFLLPFNGRLAHEQYGDYFLRVMSFVFTEPKALFRRIRFGLTGRRA